MNQSVVRSRWAAVGAAVAVTLGAGAIGLVSATSPTGATAYSPIEPCRVADTRAGEFNVGLKTSPLGPGETHVITAHGDNGECVGIPTSATGVQLNVTSLNATAGTFLAVWGSGDRPNASSLNPQPGQPPIPNAVTTGLTGDGSFNVYNQAGSVDIIVDIVGFYSDHHHDDRYYRRNEATDTFVGRATTPWVRAAANGTITAGSPGMEVRTFAASPDGRYVVDFPIDVHECGLFLQVHTPGTADIHTGHVGPFLPDEANSRVYVYIENEAGSISDRPFSLMARC